MSIAVVVMALALGQSEPPECRNPPSRASDVYWGFIEACGCDKLVTPSEASDEYERFMKACSEWRERNRPLTVVVAPASPGDTVAVPRTPSECQSPPSGVSDAYWVYIDACGCAKLEPPSRASSEFDRFWKACGDWRRRNPAPIVIVASPSPSPRPRPAAKPSPRPSPSR